VFCKEEFGVEHEAKLSDMTYAVSEYVILPNDVDLSRPVLLFSMPPGFVTVVLP
jgi:hypothetical protein